MRSSRFAIALVANRLFARKEETMTRTALLFLLALASCKPDPTTQLRVSSASVLTERYSHSRLSDWHVRASAAGRDCAVLFVETSMIMDDSIVEAIHYGAGAYDVLEGGVQNFYRERTFRGVAYKDPTGRIWTYGGVTRIEAEKVSRCH